MVGVDAVWVGPGGGDVGVDVVIGGDGGGVGGGSGSGGGGGGLEDGRRALTIGIDGESVVETVATFMRHGRTPMIRVVAHVLLHHYHFSHCGWMVVTDRTFHGAILLILVLNTMCLFTPRISSALLLDAQERPY